MRDGIRKEVLRVMLSFLLELRWIIKGITAAHLDIDQRFGVGVFQNTAQELNLWFQEK